MVVPRSLISAIVRGFDAYNHDCCGKSKGAESTGSDFQCHSKGKESISPTLLEIETSLRPSKNGLLFVRSLPLVGQSQVPEGLSLLRSFGSANYRICHVQTAVIL